MYGLDYLGGAKYGKVILANHPQGWAAGFFLNVEPVDFGNAWPIILNLCESGKCPRFRLHALWTNHTYNPAKHVPIIERELRKLNTVAAKYPHIQFEFSFICEHNIRGKQLTNLIEHLQQMVASSNITIVNSFYKGDSVNMPRVLNEVHGDKAVQKGEYNYSCDGDAAVDIDIETLKDKHKNASTFYFWTYQFNGRRNDDPKDKDNQLPPNKRKYWPTKELIESLVYLTDTKGPAKFPRDLLFKSHADQHNVPPNPTELKPVVILVNKYKKLELRLDNGVTIEISSSPEPFKNSKYPKLKWRYYFGDFGYKIAERASGHQKFPVLGVYGDDKFIGTANPAFRAGSFR